MVTTGTLLGLSLWPKEGQALDRTALQENTGLGGPSTN